MNFSTVENFLQDIASRIYLSEILLSVEEPQRRESKDWTNFLEGTKAI